MNYNDDVSCLHVFSVAPYTIVYIRAQNIHAIVVVVENITS